MLHWVNCEIESQRIWLATQAFFERPYWKRSWIVQELVLTQGEITVFCGADMLSYKYLYNLHEDLNTKLQIGRERDERCECKGPTGRLDDCRRDSILKSAAAACDRTLPFVRTDRTEGHERAPDTLLGLLYKYRNTECEDSRDKLFSMMSLQTDIPPPLVSTMLDYSIDVHLLFFIVLAMYTQGHCFFLNVKESYRISGHIDCRSTLTTFGVMLMESLSISPTSVRRFRLETPQITNPVIKPLVEFEYVTRGGGADVASLDRVKRTDRQNYHVFDAVGSQFAFRRYMRGIGIDLQLGDRLYRAHDSEVGIALRRIGQWDVPVAWVIIGQGQDWAPNQNTWARLELLQFGRLPNPADFTFPTDGSHGGRLALSITVDWHVAMSIVDGLVEMSWDHSEPRRSKSLSVSGTASRHSNASRDAANDEDTTSNFIRIPNFETRLYRDAKRHIVECHCKARGLQQPNGDELEYLFKEAGGTKTFT